MQLDIFFAYNKSNKKIHVVHVNMKCTKWLFAFTKKVCLPSWIIAINQIIAH